MDATHVAAAPPADISFMIVLNGSKYAPLLVQRVTFNSKVGSLAARRTYQTAYAPTVFPSAMRVVVDDTP